MSGGISSWIRRGLCVGGVAFTCLAAVSIPVQPVVAAGTVGVETIATKNDSSQGARSARSSQSRQSSGRSSSGKSSSRSSEGGRSSGGSRNSASSRSGSTRSGAGATSGGRRQSSRSSSGGRSSQSRGSASQSRGRSNQGSSSGGSSGRSRATSGNRGRSTGSGSAGSSQGDRSANSGRARTNGRGSASTSNRERTTSRSQQRQRESANRSDSTTRQRTTRPAQSSQRNGRQSTDSGNDAARRQQLLDQLRNRSGNRNPTLNQTGDPVAPQSETSGSKSATSQWIGKGRDARRLQEVLNRLQSRREQMNATKPGSDNAGRPFVSPSRPSGQLGQVNPDRPSVNSKPSQVPTSGDVNITPSAGPRPGGRPQSSGSGSPTRPGQTGGFDDNNSTRPPNMQQAPANQVPGSGRPQQVKPWSGAHDGPVNAPHDDHGSEPDWNGNDHPSGHKPHDHLDYHHHAPHKPFIHTNHHHHVWCGRCRCSHQPGHHTIFVDFHFDLFDPFYYPTYQRYDVFVEEYVITAPYYPPAPPAVLPPPVPTLDEAWALFNDGLLDDANVVFAEIITLAPDSAMAYAGHALTSALRGDHLTAIHDMRLAIVLEPDVLLYLPISEALVTALEDIRLTFVEAVQLVPSDVDALFMVAAMHFALGEDHEAYFAIRRALDHGDNRESTRMLHELLDARLAADYGIGDG